MRDNAQSSRFGRHYASVEGVLDARGVYWGSPRTLPRVSTFQGPSNPAANAGCLLMATPRHKRHPLKVEPQRCCHHRAQSRRRHHTTNGSPVTREERREDSRSTAKRMQGNREAIGKKPGDGVPSFGKRGEGPMENDRRCTTFSGEDKSKRASSAGITR